MSEYFDVFVSLLDAAGITPATAVQGLCTVLAVAATALGWKATKGTYRAVRSLFAWVLKRDGSELVLEPEAPAVPPSPLASTLLVALDDERPSWAPPEGPQPICGRLGDLYACGTRFCFQGGELTSIWGGGTGGREDALPHLSPADVKTVTARATEVAEFCERRDAAIVAEAKRRDARRRAAIALEDVTAALDRVESGRAGAPILKAYVPTLPPGGGLSGKGANPANPAPNAPAATEAPLVVDTDEQPRLITEIRRALAAKKTSGGKGA